MGVASDPFLQRVKSRTTARARAPWQDAHERAALMRDDAAALPTPRPTWQRVFARGVVIAGVALLALRAIGGWLAEPLTVPVANAPTWNVEMTSRSTSSTLALAYSRETGVHLLRVPGRGSNEPRVIPARLARGELHMISLGLPGLHVQAAGAPNSGVLMIGADARMITMYQHKDASGIRPGW